MLNQFAKAAWLPAFLLSLALQAKPNPGGLEPVDCWFESPPDWPDTACFSMVVPETYNDPQSRLIRFPVIKFEGGDNDDTPVLHLGGGGPGASNGLSPREINEYVWKNYWHMFAYYDRDLYVIDPRGAGTSTPAMTCPEYSSGVTELWKQDLTYEEELEASASLYRQCKDRLVESGFDPLGYSSSVVAKDIDALRHEIGVDSFHLYGVSYGSRYALTIARDYPDAVASMVLDGPVFPSLRTADYDVRNNMLAIERAFSHCANDTFCDAEFPDIEARFWRVLESLNARPMALQISDLMTYEPTTLLLSGDRLFSAVFSSIYDEYFNSTLPGLVKSLERGSYDIASSVVRDYLVQSLADPSFADASLFLHYCYEEHPFENESELDIPPNPNAFLTRMESIYSKGMDQICKVWNPASIANYGEGDAIYTDIPTLIFQGELDPVIPMENMSEQEEYFSSLIYYSLKDVAHGVISSSACAEWIAGAFYEYGMDYAKHEDCAAGNTDMVLRYISEDLNEQ